MSLNVANCSRCGKVYLKNNYGMCTNCIKDIETEYEKCLKFLRENRTCTVQELSDETGVDMKQIVKFIREGRISIKNNPNMTYGCDVCGSQIREHTICEPCRARLSKEAQNLQEDELRKSELRAKEKQTIFNIRDRLQEKDRFK